MLFLYALSRVCVCMYIENDDDDEKSHVFHVSRRSVLLILWYTVEIMFSAIYAAAGMQLRWK